MIWLRQINRFFVGHDMPNSAITIGAPTISDVTEGAYLQARITPGVISISDDNAVQAALGNTGSSMINCEREPGRRQISSKRFSTPFPRLRRSKVPGTTLKQI